MAITKCTTPIDVIGSLGTSVTDRGLTTQEFKDKFDEMPEGIKTYINEVLTVEVDAHLAKSVAYGQVIARDLSIEGIQTVTLPFKAKYIRAHAFVQDTALYSIGCWAENGFQRATHQIGTAGIRGIAGAIMINNSIDYTLGTIQNVTNSGFEINWTKGGNPTGTCSITVFALTHGEE